MKFTLRIFGFINVISWTTLAFVVGLHYLSGDGFSADIIARLAACVFATTVFLTIMIVVTRYLAEKMFE